MLIAIEGIDGSGKGTQTALLVEHLRQRGNNASSISFPRYGDNPFALAIASYLNGDFGPANTVAPQLAGLLYAGDRFCSRPALISGTNDAILVCDRYVDSNIAHQAAKLPSSQWPSFIDWINQIEYGIYALPRPSLTLLLSLPVGMAVELIGKKKPRSYTALRADAHEEDHAYLRRCSEVYDYLATLDGSRYRSIQCVDDGLLLTPEAVASKIIAIVSSCL